MGASLTSPNGEPSDIEEEDCLGQGALDLDGLCATCGEAGKAKDKSPPGQRFLEESLFSPKGDLQKNFEEAPLVSPSPDQPLGVLKFVSSTALSSLSKESSVCPRKTALEDSTLLKLEKWDNWCELLV